MQNCSPSNLKEKTLTLFEGTRSRVGERIHSYLSITLHPKSELNLIEAIQVFHSVQRMQEKCRYFQSARESVVRSYNVTSTNWIWTPLGSITINCFHSDFVRSHSFAFEASLLLHPRRWIMEEQEKIVSDIILDSAANNHPITNHFRVLQQKSHCIFESSVITTVPPNHDNHR